MDLDDLSCSSEAVFRSCVQADDRPDLNPSTVLIFWLRFGVGAIPSIMSMAPT